MKILMSVSAFLFLGFCATAQESGSSHQAKSNARIGNMKMTKFMEINAKGTQLVNAITPTSDPLSAADQQLFTQVAMGSMRQLAISQAVLATATSEDVRMLAQSEVEEQTNNSAKLKEVAQAKGLTLPAEADAETKALVGQVQGMSAGDVNQFYIREGGIRGHELLQQTMTTVRRDATDASMKAMAAATLPVIKAHLKVSRKVEGQLAR